MNFHLLQAPLLVSVPFCQASLHLELFPANYRAHPPSTITKTPQSRQQLQPLLSLCRIRFLRRNFYITIIATGKRVRRSKSPWKSLWLWLSVVGSQDPVVSSQNSMVGLSSQADYGEHPLESSWPGIGSGKAHAFHSPSSMADLVSAVNQRSLFPLSVCLVSAGAYGDLLDNIVFHRSGVHHSPLTFCLVSTLVVGDPMTARIHQSFRSEEHRRSMPYVRQISSGHHCAVISGDNDVPRRISLIVNVSFTLGQFSFLTRTLPSYFRLTVTPEISSTNAKLVGSVAGLEDTSLHRCVSVMTNLGQHEFSWWAFDAKAVSWNFDSPTESMSPRLISVLIFYFKESSFQQSSYMECLLMPSYVSLLFLMMLCESPMSSYHERKHFSQNCEDNNLDLLKWRNHRIPVSIPRSEEHILSEPKITQLNISTVGYQSPSGTNL